MKENTVELKIRLKQKMMIYIDHECISTPGVLQKWIKSYDLYDYLKRRLVEYRVHGEDEAASLLQYVLISASNQTISEVKYHENEIDCDDGKLHFWTTCKVDCTPNKCQRAAFYIKLSDDYSVLLKLFYNKFILSDGVLSVHKVGDSDIFIRLQGEIFSYTERIPEEKHIMCPINSHPIYHDPFLIKDIKFNGPATIVFWEDGEKTVVKMDELEKEFDVEKALMAAYTKRALSTLSNARERSIDLTLDMAREKYDAYLKEIKSKK